jgi:hypothetical protein
MSDAEIEASVDVLRRVPAAVASWSEGNAAIDPLDIQVVDHPVARLSDDGGGRFWPAPRDVSDDIRRHARRGEYDSVFVLWPTDGATPLCGWGCSIGRSNDAAGAGYSAIISDHWAGYAAREFPEEGFVHEWLHQVESAFRELGVGERRLPGLHDVEGRTSARGSDVAPFGRGYVEHHRRTDTWQPWYRDLMTGTVAPRDGVERPLGLTPDLWDRWREVTG